MFDVSLRVYLKKRVPQIDRQKDRQIGVGYLVHKNDRGAQLIRTLAMPTYRQ